MTDAKIPLTRALISVYNKTGLAELAAQLHAAGVELVSTGSTAKTIAAEGIPVIEVSDVTGFPEGWEGRVKTLHPHVHAGILADTRKEDHLKQLADLGIAAFNLVIVNLYPFAETVASGASVDDCIEQIDIGGPSMVRGAAKNHPSVAIVVDPQDYSEVISAAQTGGFTFSQRRKLATKAYRHTADYDVAVASWLSAQGSEGPDAEKRDKEKQFPSWRGATWERAAVLRYGENPHQNAALYFSATPGLASAEQLGGKEMSYNNYTDADAAWRAAHDFSDPAVAIIKHANPCGVAIGTDIAQAHAKAHACDPVSAYGGVIAANRTVTLAAAEAISEIFTEVIIAPDYEQAALVVLQAKKNLRILKAPAYVADELEMRQISGGFLIQERDNVHADGDDPANWILVAGDPADAATLKDLEFAWRACRSVKSNAILLAHDGASVGVGMGQVNRVDSAYLAVKRAADRALGAVASSDAFFPFPDGLQILIDGGVRAVVQPGGSIRDEAVIAAAQEAGITMYFTGSRHFAH